MSLNAFENGSRKVIPAVLVYLFKGDSVLMIHRNTQGANDHHQGKWNGLGGKLELDESPVQAARREIREESGLEIAEEDFRPLGTLQFPNFKAHKNEDWLVFVFSVHLKAADAKKELKANSEGELSWIERKNVPSLNLWPGDTLFIPYVMSGRPFIGTLWYEGPVVARHWIHPLDRI